MLIDLSLDIILEDMTVHNPSQRFVLGGDRNYYHTHLMCHHYRNRNKL